MLYFLDLVKKSGLDGHKRTMALMMFTFHDLFIHISDLGLPLEAVSENDIIDFARDADMFMKSIGNTN